MKYKLRKILFIFILMFGFIANVNAQTTIKEDASKYDGDIYIIGSSKFDSDVIVTGTMVGVAGAREAFLHFGCYFGCGENDYIFKPEDLKIYYYSGLDKVWSLLPATEEDEFRDLTEKEVEELTKNLKIYYVNDEEKIIEIPYSAELPEGYKLEIISDQDVWGEDEITPAVTYKDGKLIVPATTRFIETYATNEEGYSVLLDAFEQNDGVFENETVVVKTLEELKDAIANEKEEIRLGNDITDITETIVIPYEVEFRGAGYKLSFKDIEKKNGVASGLVITGDNSEVYDLTIEMNSAAGWQGNYALQVYNTEGAYISNYTGTKADAALLINSSSVDVGGNINLTGNEFGGIEVSMGEGENLSESNLFLHSYITMDDEAVDKPVVWVENGQGFVHDYTESLVQSVDVPNLAGKMQLYYYTSEDIYKKVSVTNEEELQTAVLLPCAEEITLANDIDLPTALEVSRIVSIDLNGHNLTVSEDTEGNGVFHVVEGGNLTINGEGIVDGTGKNKWNIVVFADGGNVTLNGGTYTNANATILPEDTDSEHFDVIYAKGNGHVEINGGRFEGKTPAWLLNIKDSDRATASIIVNGGTFVGLNPADSKAEGEGTNFVNPERKVVETNGEYTVTQIEDTDVVIVNNTVYETLQEAVDSAKEYSTITLLNDIDMPTAVEVSKIVSIDLNGHNLTVSEDTEGNGVFHVVEGGNLTINGEGIVDGTGKNKWNIVVFADGGNVTLNGGTYTNANATILPEDTDSEHFDVIYAKGNGHVEINGGRFEGKTPAWLLNIKDSDRATASIIVNGGTFVGLNPADSKAEGEGTNFVADGYTVVEANGEYTVVSVTE